MTDFSNLNKLAITADNTTEYELTEIPWDPTPALILRSANEGNAGYMNGLLRLTGKAGRRKAKLKLDAKTMDDMRDNDKSLYPEHVIVGWSNVVDAKGKSIDFTPEACKDFLTALPDWIFDGIRGFATDPENFINVIDSEEKAKN